MGEEYTLGLHLSAKEFLDDKDIRQEILTDTLIISIYVALSGKYLQKSYNVML